MASTPNRNNQLGIKFLLTTFSLTMVLGFWNMFARKAQSDQNSSGQDTPTTELWEETNADDFVLPTLVPLVWAPVENNAGLNHLGETELPADIREVSAPTPRPVVQQQAPVVESVVIGGQQPQPASPGQPRPQPTSVTTTGSSK